VEKVWFTEVGLDDAERLGLGVEAASAAGAEMPSAASAAIPDTTERIRMVKRTSIARPGSA
jgi:hypothetical protein